MDALQDKLGNEIDRELAANLKRNGGSVGMLRGSLTQQVDSLIASFELNIEVLKKLRATL